MSDPGTIRLLGVPCVIDTCITCGVVYTIPEVVWTVQKAQGGYHYCPNGHQQGWSTEGCENAQLRRERDRLQQRLAQKDDEIGRQKEQTDAAWRTASAYKGHATKLRQRAKAGVCPCCHRNVRQLALHMKHKHPGFSAEPPEMKTGAAAGPHHHTARHHDRGAGQ